SSFALSYYIHPLLHFCYSTFTRPRPPPSPLFPYTTLFRSRKLGEPGREDDQVVGAGPLEIPEHAGLAGAAVRDDRGRTCPDYLIDRKSTRLNSSHGSSSYAVFCLKKKITSVIIRTCATHVR